MRALWLKNPSVSRDEVANLVWRLSGENKLELEYAFQAGSLFAYLKLWERNLWLYVSITVSLLTVVAVYALPSEYPFVAIRWVLGSIFVLFIPGYLLVEVLFPSRRDLDSIERIALSIGLSLALVPLVGLLLNYTVWGIRLIPVIVSLVILTLGLSAAALIRHYTIESRTRNAKLI